jgi:hypothetical protein
LLVVLKLLILIVISDLVIVELFIRAELVLSWRLLLPEQEKIG